MNGQSSNSARFMSGDIEKDKNKRQVDYFQNTRKKRSLASILRDKKKIILIAVGVIIIIALAVWITVMLVSRSMSDDHISGPTSVEQLDALREEFQQVLHYGGSADELEANIKSFVELHPDEADLIVSAKIILIDLYQRNGNPALAIQVINDSLDANNLSYPNQAALLARAADVYESTGQVDEEIDAIERLLQLPDDIVLEGESWANVKIAFRSRLRQLTGNGE